MRKPIRIWIAIGVLALALFAILAWNWMYHIVATLSPRQEEIL